MGKVRICGLPGPERLKSARAWIDSGAEVTVPAYARRYGVDRYRARKDLVAVGFRFAPDDRRWTVRPTRRPKPPPPEPFELERVWVGDRLMVVVDYTPGGVQYGYFEDDVLAEEELECDF